VAYVRTQKVRRCAPPPSLYVGRDCREDSRECGVRDHNTCPKPARVPASDPQASIGVLYVITATDIHEIRLDAQHFWRGCRSVLERVEHSSKGRTVRADTNDRRATTATYTFLHTASLFSATDSCARTDPPFSLVSKDIFRFYACAAGLGTPDVRSLVRKGRAGGPRCRCC
jgi:hypothetical protein